MFHRVETVFRNDIDYEAETDSALLPALGQCAASFLREDAYAEALS